MQAWPKITLLLALGLHAGCDKKVRITSDRVGLDGLSRPGKPTDVTAVPAPTSIVLSWVAPTDNGSSPVTDYKIQQSSDGGQLWTDFADAVSTQLSATVTGLQSSQQYQFRIAAENAAGTGEYSDPTSPVTLDAAPGEQIAALVLGQPDFQSNQSNISGLVTAESLNYPADVFYDGTRLYVADMLNHRVLIWNSLPTTNNQPADIVLGQADFESNIEHAEVTAATLNWPYSVYSDGTRLFVADAGNNRVLIWNSIPTSNNQEADLALGQLNLTSRADNFLSAAANRLKYPVDVFSDGTRLFVVDQGYHRVLVWNQIPTATATPADLVLGQANFSGTLPNRRMTAINAGNGDPVDPPSDITGDLLSSPSGVYSDGTKLVVTDTTNSRVLVWNTMPTTNGQVADFVLGQPDFATVGPNTGGISASTIFNPVGVTGHAGQLLVSDFMNNRILVWNALSGNSQQPADFILGQPSSIASDPNAGGVSETSLFRPERISAVGARLFVADSVNNRVLIWQRPTP